jgi:hypothetical protein
MLIRKLRMIITYLKSLSYKLKIDKGRGGWYTFFVHFHPHTKALCGLVVILRELDLAKDYLLIFRSLVCGLVHNSHTFRS